MDEKKKHFLIRSKPVCVPPLGIRVDVAFFFVLFSAGVVLTLSIPAVSDGTSATTLKSPLVPMGSAHGHTGHVRFLTAIELPEGFDMKFPPATSDSTGSLNRK